MVTAAGYLPDAAAIRTDLDFMTSRWGELESRVKFELRSFAENVQPHWAQFTTNRLDDAVAWAAEENGQDRNVYVVRNPIRFDHSGSADDAAILCALFAWADCDTLDATSNVRRFDGPRWNAAVMTGRVPAERVHIYWELTKPAYDLGAWRLLQVNIAAHFQSDPVVINPSRIMRLGGTVSYPDSRKQARGYVQEFCPLRTAYNDGRMPVEFERLLRVFGNAAAAAHNVRSGCIHIDMGPQPLDRERARIQALSGEEWHAAVIRLVASYVAKGNSDEEIHILTAPLTLAGYTFEQTRAEVQTAIEGARRKGWAPEEPAYADPDEINFDAPPPPPPPPDDDDIDFDAPPGGEKAEPAASVLEWFDDIEPVLTGAYLVKGVIDAGAMSVVYGPSNSGKTFFALDIAFHVANGASWQQRRVCAAAVLYLAAEGGRGVANRIAALRQETGARDVPLALRRAGLDLLKSQADLQHIANLVVEIMAMYPGLPVLIVIDTLSRVIAGGDENSAQDMTALIRNVDAIRAHTGAHIMIVHHTGKDAARGARGHSSLRAATDTEIEVQSEDGARAAMVTKQRDNVGGETFAFSLKNVLLGQDQDGDDVSSCVVEWEDSEAFVAAKKASKGRGKNQQLIMEAFDQMISEGLARPNPGGVGMPDPGRFWTIETEELRRVAQGKMSGDRLSALFRQAWETLTARDGLFVTGQDLCWRVDRPVR